MAMTARAQTATKGFRLVLVSMADGKTEGVPVGWYLASYRPRSTRRRRRSTVDTRPGTGTHVR